MTSARGLLLIPLAAAALFAACTTSSINVPAPRASATATGAATGAGAATPTPSGATPVPSATTPTPSATTSNAGANPTPSATGSRATSGPSASPGVTPSPTATTATCISGPNPASTTIVRNPVKLGAYKVDPSKIFVAGISSGGFFGVQMHVAHSATFKGAAIYAGGVYDCSGSGNIAQALLDCGGETLPNCQAAYSSELSSSESYLDAQSAAGTIDPSSNLRGQPVYLWSGTKDQVVNPQEKADLDSEYLHYGAKVTFENTYPANHGWESPQGEVPCPTATEPYMISCDNGSTPYDSEKTWLTLFFGALNPRNDGTLGGSLINFDQTEFGAAATNSMDTNGWVFVPQSCATGATCGFILALHGCIQNQALAQQQVTGPGTKWTTEAGIDEWADTNNIIVLYPFAIEADATQVGTTVGTNPMGCWDWWGYDDPNFALKSGTQMSILYKMVQRVTGVP
jgi:poly(3-hydroxybutyrate) depolymerase